MISPTTPEGVYNLTLLQTNNKDLAEQAKVEAKAIIKLRALQVSPMDLS